MVAPSAAAASAVIATVWVAVLALNTWLEEGLVIVMAGLGAPVRVMEFRYLSRLVNPSGPVPLRSSGLLGSRPLACSHSSGMPSWSESWGGVVAARGGKLPTSFCELIIRPV